MEVVGRSASSITEQEIYCRKDIAISSRLYNLHSMKMISIAVDVDGAKEFLTTIEEKISEKHRIRDELNKEISRLEERAKTVRDQLQPSNGERSPRGENKRRLKEFLAKLPDGATLSTISKSTGVSVSSTAYTLKNNSEDFVFERKTSLWKVK
jgi:septal ring factor EnvC (AmiA/AmiB activator)